MIEGVNHVTLSVRDLDQSLLFYKEILGCKPLAKWDEGAYLLAGSLWLCLTLDAKTRTGPLPEYSHIAFDARGKNFEALSLKIRASGTTIWKDNVSEGSSLYFLDPNGHKLEIHATSLKDRMAACKRTPYSGMIFFDET